MQDQDVGWYVGSLDPPRENLVEALLLAKPQISELYPNLPASVLQGFRGALFPSLGNARGGTSKNPKI